MLVVPLLVCSAGLLYSSRPWVVATGPWIGLTLASDEGLCVAVRRPLVTSPTINGEVLIGLALTTYVGAKVVWRIFHDVSDAAQLGLQRPKFRVGLWITTTRRSKQLYQLLW